MHANMGAPATPLSLSLSLSIFIAIVQKGRHLVQLASWFPKDVGVQVWGRCLHHAYWEI